MQKATSIDVVFCLVTTPHQELPVDGLLLSTNSVLAIFWLKVVPETRIPVSILNGLEHILRFVLGQIMADFSAFL